MWRHDFKTMQCQYLWGVWDWNNMLINITNADIWVNAWGSTRDIYSCYPDVWPLSNCFKCSRRSPSSKIPITWAQVLWFSCRPCTTFGLSPLPKTACTNRTSVDQRSTCLSVENMVIIGVSCGFPAAYIMAHLMAHMSGKTKKAWLRHTCAVPNITVCSTTSSNSDGIFLFANCQPGWEQHQTRHQHNYLHCVYTYVYSYLHTPMANFVCMFSYTYVCILI